MKRILTMISLSMLFLSSMQATTANELLIWDKLQSTAPKGYVLLMRHSYAPGVGDPENFRLNDCSTQRNLSDVGRQDAEDVGQWLKRRDIKIFQVQSSRWCRAKETAQLLGLGKVRLNRNLDSLFEEVDALNHPQTAAVRKLIQNHRNKTGLLVLVGHYVNIAALTGTGVASGEGIIVKANARGEIKILGATPKLNR